MAALIDTAEKNRYDQVPYDSHPFAQSNPDHLATLAKLFGMKPASPSQCRVLELGCASGGNIIPLAVSFPNSKFVGIDLSIRQVAHARETIDALSLTNVEIKHCDLMRVDKSFGEFDYIIAHGVYSWVPDRAQEKILEICRNNLSSNGVAYISYNTYPGWHYRGMIRDMMLYHTTNLPDPITKATQARALLDFLAQAVPTNGNAYGIMLKNEVDYLRRSSDSYLLYDHLSDANIPVYFYQFIERANRHGLQYLGEAEFKTMLTRNLPQEVDETLRRISKDIVSTEQYMDFVRNRMFRQTILCRQEQRLNRNLTHEDVLSFHVASPLKPASASVDIDSDKPELFRINENASFTTIYPASKAAFQYLARIYPRSIQFQELLKEARSSLKEQAPWKKDEMALAASLLTAFSSGVIELRTEPDRFIAEVSERPKVTELVRHQAKVSERVTNQLHRVVEVDVFTRHVLMLLDGTRTQTEIVDELMKLVKSNVLEVKRDGEKLEGGEILRQTLAEVMTRALNLTSSSNALLVG